MRRAGGSATTATAWRVRPGAAIAACVGILGCGGEGGRGEHQGEGPPISEAIIEGTFRGMAIFDVDGRPRFEPCGDVAARELALADSAGGDLEGAYQELVGEPGGRLYVEVRGRVVPSDRGTLGLAPDRRLIVEAVRRASLDAEGCDEPLDAISFRAQGNEPFWSIDVTPLDITLQRPDMNSVTFPFAAPVDEGVTRTYDAVQPGGPTLHLVLTEERCTDSMSGFWFPFSALAVVDADSLRGCAAEGW